MKLASEGRDPSEALRLVQLRPTALQDFRPLTGCLEWELSEFYWNHKGLLPFVEDAVPFFINNSGRLSEHAAALLFANCAEVPGTGPIRVLELGAGTGLFARYFLECFRAMCLQEEKDFYDRLVFYITDRSTRTVDQWQERGVFEGYREGRAVLGCCDALYPSRFLCSTGEAIVLSDLRAVFCNYILDVLPAAVLRKGAEGPEELHIRTHLTEDRALLAQYTRLSPDEIRELVRSDEPEAKARLVPLISLLDFETAFLPFDGDPALVAEALPGSAELERVVLNHGAISCIESCLSLLQPAGFILINDYGPVRNDEVAAHSTSQRFGPTSALGVNFPFLERHFGENSRVVTPEGDDQRSIHSRLVVRGDVPATVGAYQNRFGSPGVDFFESPAEEARGHRTAGRSTEALESYRLALSRSPRDWQLMGEIAEFVGLQLRDYHAGRELIRGAIERNPWYSAWLWNVLGDILFLDGNVEAAHESYLQAQRIQPGDARTNLNLAYTYFEFGEYAQALESLAVAFSADAQGLYRPRLLEKQHQVLGAIGSRWLGEHERSIRRLQRMM